jgi:hypothetical protein
MPPIDRPAAKECVRTALKQIAVFINAVTTCILRKGSRIVLNEGMLDTSATVGDFIDVVKSKAVFMDEPASSLQEQDGDLN